MFISILLDKVREMMDLEEMELKELKDNLKYKEGYLKEKINTYDQKRKKYKIIAIGAVSLFFGIRHHLYTHVYDVIRLGPVHIGPSQNLLSDIREREGRF